MKIGIYEELKSRQKVLNEIHNIMLDRMHMALIIKNLPPLFVKEDGLDEADKLQPISKKIG